MRLGALFGKGARSEAAATPATTLPSDSARVEHAVATLATLQEEPVALRQKTVPLDQTACNPVDLSLGKPIGEAVGKLIAQTIDAPTGQRVGEAVHKAVDDALAQNPTARRDGLFVMNVGKSIRLSGPPGLLPEEPPADAIAEHLLAWLAAEFPVSAGKWVAYPDLRDHVFPWFQAQTGLKRSLGSVLRGLKKITKSRNRDYTDHRSGEHRTLKEYLVPDPAVVELAEEKRKRCA